MDGTAVDVLVVGAEPVGPAAAVVLRQGAQRQGRRCAGGRCRRLRAAVDLACSSGRGGFRRLHSNPPRTPSSTDPHDLIAARPETCRDGGCRRNSIGLISVQPNARVPTLLIDAHNAACFLPSERERADSGVSTLRRHPSCTDPAARAAGDGHRRPCCQRAGRLLARRAAGAAGATHKVLLYHFDGVDDLLEHAIQELREQRTRRLGKPGTRWRRGRLGQWVRLVWAALLREETRVLDQAIGLVLYDTERYQRLGAGVSDQYLPALLSRCPSQWSVERRPKSPSWCWRPSAGSS